jgi:hypothetical protein
MDPGAWAAGCPSPHPTVSMMRTTRSWLSCLPITKHVLWPGLSAVGSRSIARPRPTSQQPKERPPGSGHASAMCAQLAVWRGSQRPELSISMGTHAAYGKRCNADFISYVTYALKLHRNHLLKLQGQVIGWRSSSIHSYCMPIFVSWRVSF